MYLVYILRSNNLSYIGMTNDFMRRWKQHNGILKGGAKYTKKSDNWYPICIIDGFETMKEALQCEWKLKRVRGYINRLKNVNYHMTSVDKWTKNSPEIKLQNLNVYVHDDYKYLFSIDIRQLYWI